MPEQLTDLLHASVDDVPVPHPSAYDILGRGRSLRRRRRVATGVVAAVAVLAAGLGGALVHDLGTPDSRDNQEIADQPTGGAVEAYDQSGAWVVGDQLTIGQKTVTLPQPPTYLAQTSAGVVAQLRNGPGDSTFVLVRPDGTQTTLTIPSTTFTINGDLSAPRVAWVDDGDDVLDLHVWDVEADREVGNGTIPAPGTSPANSGQFLTPAFLDGDSAYVGADDGTGHRVRWATGAVSTIEHAPFSVRNDVLAWQAKDGWAFDDAAGNRQLGVLPREFHNPLLSPDGRFIAVARTNETEDRIGFATVSGGEFTEIPGLRIVSVWTPGGRMLSTSEDGTAVRICTTSGDCETRAVDPAGLADNGILLADVLNVG
ncbi:MULTISPECIES: hypothetical protein [unclassified Nocardioides]|uniref:hypothetical protein n=1 Tax=unclassified Nocardioides TaxID=2615069 RepID=UPI0006FA3785|nr:MULTISPECIES: hypothetical protein [unclassified Nocardioides]KRA39035.1 hypothetical protein ASD81_10780 [Nocardioides sp. Root614]KRA92994.1 hypothetical protein ASD84_11045 [Nocardioides sp. Root682]